MKKALILAGAYMAASLFGALTGAILWPHPLPMLSVAGFMMMAPLFQLVTLVTSFNTQTPILKTPVLGIFLVLVFGGTMMASAIWYYRSNRKWAVLTFGIPVFVASLPGAALFCQVMAI